MKLIKLFLNQFWDLIKLNLYFVLFSLPLVTIIPSLLAMISIATKMIDDEYIEMFSEYKTAFKANMKKGVFFEIFLLLFFVVYMISSRYYANTSQMIFYLFNAVCFLIFIMSNFFVIQMVRIDIALSDAVKNSAILMIANAPQSITASILSILVLLPLIGLLPLTLPLVLFIGFSPSVFINCYFLWPIVKTNVAANTHE